MKKTIAIVLSLSMICSNIAWAAPVGLLKPTEKFIPPLLTGMILNPRDPMDITFIMDSGYSHQKENELKEEGDRLSKYFMAALTIPDKDIWVNLSPDKTDRVVTDELIETDLGKDLLEQDYVLKQMAASLLSQETKEGKTFWSEYWRRSEEEFGVGAASTGAIDLVQRVWILPDKAKVFYAGTQVHVSYARLKVMLESDYRVLGRDKKDKFARLRDELYRKHILPALEKEVNGGENFARTRQIYNSLILAKWYKENVKNGVLKKNYADKKKIGGINIESLKDFIYKKYLDIVKNGAFEEIRGDVDTLVNKKVPRKYFSGGIPLTENLTIERASSPATQLGNTYMLKTVVYRKNDVISVSSSPIDTKILGITLESKNIALQKSYSTQFKLVKGLSEEVWIGTEKKESALTLNIPDGHDFWSPLPYELKMFPELWDIFTEEYFHRLSDYSFGSSAEDSFLKSPSRRNINDFLITLLINEYPRAVRPIPGFFLPYFTKRKIKNIMIGKTTRPDLMAYYSERDVDVFYLNRPDSPEQEIKESIKNFIKRINTGTNKAETAIEQIWLENRLFGYLKDVAWSKYHKYFIDVLFQLGVPEMSIINTLTRQQNDTSAILCVSLIKGSDNPKLKDFKETEEKVIQACHVSDFPANFYTVLLAAYKMKKEGYDFEIDVIPGIKPSSYTSGGTYISAGYSNGDYDWQPAGYIGGTTYYTPGKPAELTLRKIERGSSPAKEVGGISFVSFKFDVEGNPLEFEDDMNSLDGDISISIVNIERIS